MKKQQFECNEFLGLACDIPVFVNLLSIVCGRIFSFCIGMNDYHYLNVIKDTLLILTCKWYDCFEKCKLHTYVWIMSSEYHYSLLERITKRVKFKQKQGAPRLDSLHPLTPPSFLMGRRKEGNNDDWQK